MNLYVSFAEQPPRKGRRIVAVISKSSGLELGGIAWYSGWRQYVFIPNPETLWSEDCLAAVREQILTMRETPR